MRSARELVPVPEGLTLEQIAAILVPDEAARELLEITIAGEPMPRAWWPRLRPRPGAIVEGVMLPAGGPDTLRMVLTAAVVVAAAAVVVATGGTALAAYGPLIGAGITIAGTLAVNALVPPQKPELGGDSDRSSPTYSLTNSENRLSPWGVVPVLLGRMRVYPSLAAEEVTRPAGDTVYLTTPLLWTQGKAHFEELHIGETPISNYVGVATEWIDADPDESPVFDSYPYDVHVEVVSAALTKAGGSVTRRTQGGTSKISVEVVFEQGLIGYGEKTGDQFGQSVSFEIKAALATGGDDFVLGTPTVNKKNSNPVREVFEYEVPEGQYDVRVRRTSDDTTDTYKRNASTWALLRSIRYEQPIKAKFVTASVQTVKATNQLSGAVRTYNAVGCTVCADWNAETGTWIERETNNPAALYRYVLQLPTQPEPYDDDEIDLARLQDWHEYCADQLFTCGIVLDWPATQDEVLELIAQCGRARPCWRDGKRSVVWDQEQTIPVDCISPALCRNFQWTHSFMPETHGYRVRFKNADKGYADDEVIAYFDGYDASNARRFEELQPVGVTDQSNAWWHGRWMYAQAKLRPETYTFELHWRHLLFGEGDLIEIQHYAMLVGTGQGWITALTTSGGQITTLTIDNDLTLDPGKRYLAIVFDSAGLRHELPLVNGGVLADTFELETPVSDSSGIAVGDHCAIGERGKATLPAIVSKIEPISEDLDARITAVPAFWVQDGLQLPDFDDRIGEPAGVLTPVLWSVRSDQTVAQRDADGSIHLQLIVAVYGDGARWLTRISGIDVRCRPDVEGGVDIFVQSPPEATIVIVPGVEADRSYFVSARYRMRDGTTGPWTAETRHDIVGVYLPPPDVSAVVFDGDGISFRLDSPPPDLAGFLVRYGANAGLPWDTATPLQDAIVRGYSLPGAELPLEAREVLVKAVSTAGIESANPTRLAVTPSQFLQRLVWYTKDQGELGWPGTITGGKINGSVIEADDTSVWLRPDGMWLEDGAANDPDWLGASWAALEYQFDFYVPSSVGSTDKLWLDIVADGPVKVERRFSGDAVAVEPTALPPGVYDDVYEDDTYDIGPDSAATIVEEGTLEPGITDDGSFTNISSRPWLLWRQSLRAVASQLVSFRVTSATGGGNVRTVLRRVRVLIDAEEITETQTLTLSAANFTITPTKKYRGISYIHPVLLNSGQAGGATGIVVHDPISPTAPVIHAINSAGTTVAAVVNVTIGGY